METEPNPRVQERIAWFLLAGLGVFIIVLIAYLGNYQPFVPAYMVSPTRVIQESSPTELPVSTPTSTLTQRPTWTLRPLDTPTVTQTPTVTPEATRVMLPTLTAALPYKFNFRYDLSTPSPETAEQITSLMRQLPDLIYDTSEERQSGAYHLAYKYAEFAYREAILRYPDAEEAIEWRWGLAFSQAHTGNPAAGNTYADLLLQGFTEQNITVDTLPRWFHSHEQGLTLAVHTLGETSGYTLFEVQPGEMFLLMRKTASQPRIFPLFGTFNFEPGIPTVFYYGDLTGDGSIELAFYRQAGGDTRLLDPVIFDLSGDSPTLLPVEENQPVDVRMGFAVSLSCPSCTTGQALALELEATIYPPCPVFAMRSYRWNGSQFTSQPPVYTSQPVEASLAYCEIVQAHAKDFLPSEANVALLEAMKPSWPPALDLSGFRYPEDSEASLSYHLGIFQALAGDAANATRTLRDVADLNVKNWSASASRFLENYKDGAELYRACSSVQECSPGRAMQQLLAKEAPDDLDNSIRMLWQAGLTTGASGTFDFNQDGKEERWFTMRARPEQALEFWILVNTTIGVQAILVDFVEESKPDIYFSVAFPNEAVFQLEPQKGYALRLTKERNEPYIEEFTIKPALTTYTRDELAKAEENLFSGVPAGTIRQQLEGVLKSGRFNCLNDRICDRFYYVLGLAYELSGRDREAIDTYIKLWWENKNSPFTTMARSKLIFNPPITPGPSPTATGTVTRTPTAGPSPTGGPTSTEDTYPYPEPTYPTTTSEPYP